MKTIVRHTEQTNTIFDDNDLTYTERLPATQRVHSYDEKSHKMIV